MNILPNKTRLFTISVIVIISLMVIILALVAATLSAVNNQKNSNNVNQIISTASTTSPLTSVTGTDKTSTATSIAVKSLSDTINSAQLMFHLEYLQTIADNNSNTRALGTSGFNATLDYIDTQLRSKTNFQIFRQEFFVRRVVIVYPMLTVTINSVHRNYTYRTDFIETMDSPPGNLLVPNRLTVIPNSGCDDQDWQNATPYPATNSVVLVIHNQNCSVEDKSIIAQKYNIIGFLVYDSDVNATGVPIVSVASNTTFPAMALSYTLGAELIAAAQDTALTNISIGMFIVSGNSIIVNISTENLCADTPTGSKTQTIVVGSHSDSIENFSGINDNGSGAMATLVLAMNLAQLFETSSYEKYRYRIRFCWFAAEERGLLGSYHHVEEANSTTVEGDRLKDYLMMLNFDMLASPNYRFGIFDSNTLPNQVSSAVQNGSRNILQIFRNWFSEQKLPWDNSSFGIRSDYVPFLVSGVACGAIESGADGTKTLEQRNRYDRMLGHGYGGIAGTHFDPCYHKACDTIENVNPFAYETMTKAAAHALETLARMPDLYSWLYTAPTTTKN